MSRWPRSPHLFDDQEAVSAWVTEVFVKQLQDNLGKSTAPGQKLVSAERVEVQGFHDEAVAMATVQEGSNGLVSATVLDFRVGRLLGVAFVVTAGTVQRREMVEHLGADLERQIVRVVLGTG